MHRDGIQPAAFHAGDGIGAARACRHAERGDLVVDSRIRLSSDGACLFMVVKIAVKSRLMSESVIQVHRTASGHHKCIGDPLVYQLLGNIIRNFHSHK